MRALTQDVTLHVVYSPSCRNGCSPFEGIDTVGYARQSGNNTFRRNGCSPFEGIDTYDCHILQESHMNVEMDVARLRALTRFKWVVSFETFHCRNGCSPFEGIDTR